MKAEEAHLLKVGAKMDLKTFGLYLHTYHASKIKFSDLLPERAETSKNAVRLARKLIAKKRQKGYMVATSAQMMKSGFISQAAFRASNPRVKARWYVMPHPNYQKGKILFNVYVACEKV